MGPGDYEGAQFLVAQPKEANSDMEINDLGQLVPMLERAGDTATAAKHRRVLLEKKREAAEKEYVAPLSQRVTLAHKQVAEVNQKLEKAVAHFERLSEGLEHQRQWVQQLSDELEEREAAHRRLVVELNAKFVPPQQDAQPQALSVAGILGGTIESIPLSFAGLGFDDAEYDMEEADKRELADRTTRLQSELSAAVRAMFGQAAEKAKAFKTEQEQMALRLAGKRRRQEGDRPAPGSMGLPPPEPIDEDGPEAVFYDGITESAARWTPRLHSPESGADSWMRWCKPYVRELLLQAWDLDWVQEARQDMTVDQMAEDICTESWHDGADNRVNILGFFVWAADHDREMLRWALRRHWEELRRIKDEMRDLLGLPRDEGQRTSDVTEVDVETALTTGAEGSDSVAPWQHQRSLGSRAEIDYFEFGWAKQKQNTGKDQHRFYFAHTTSWGQKAWDYLNQSDGGVAVSDTVMIAEHHLHGAQQVQAIKRLSRSGEETVQEERATSMETQWTSQTVRMRDIDVVFVSLYLVTGLGLQGETTTTLAEVAGHVRSQGKPCVIAGDWNMEIDEVAESGIQTYLHGVFRAAPGEAPGGASAAWGSTSGSRFQARCVT
ncbi:unnamed protein product [Prorocentrum cordatum]|uniref:Endonuclease/exonuclease/phosphatase domain-containing protein n=1 Tax=Prorocentrum cordatum TaxID=2364126 RepID=A0ABN9U6J6_9DINO|nr:unnamed protein product [Polarella glacialis]